MPLPPNFDSWDHLKSLILKYHNKAVRQYFKNQTDDDISTPKASLKQGCLIRDTDTVDMTMMRMWLFEVTVGHLQATNPVYYGIPYENRQRGGKFTPEVRLVFAQPRSEVDDDSEYKPHISEITFRLINETSETITRTEVERIARAIKNEIATPPLVWQKGWYKYTYEDPQRGYDFRLLVRSKSEGEQTVRQVLGIQGHPFDSDKGTYHDHDRSYPINPGTEYIYGRNRRKYVQRPRVNVKFRYAQLHLHGIPNPINLVSVGSRLRSAIEVV